MVSTGKEMEVTKVAASNTEVKTDLFPPSSPETLTLGSKSGEVVIDFQR